MSLIIVLDEVHLVQYMGPTDCYISFFDQQLASYRYLELVSNLILEVVVLAGHCCARKLLRVFFCSATKQTRSLSSAVLDDTIYTDLQVFF